MEHVRFMYKKRSSELTARTFVEIDLRPREVFDFQTAILHILAQHLFDNHLHCVHRTLVGVAQILVVQDDS